MTTAFRSMLAWRQGGHIARGNSRRFTRPDFEPLEPRQLLAASVIGRHIFYNRSAFDGNDASANRADDAAIAIDKTALLPGQIASFGNYTSYSRGINGIMIDVVDLANASGLSADDFAFRSGNNFDPSSWGAAPTPSQIVVRPDEGVNGSDRVTIVWPDNAIERGWVHVSLLATPDTGLDVADEFYFGNAIGDSGDGVGRADVDLADERGPRNNPHAFFNPAGVDDVFDYNRDRYVNATDQIVARNHTTALTTSLRLLGQTNTAITITYDPFTGEFVASSDVPVTTLEIVSRSGGFTDDVDRTVLDGPFDVGNSDKIFKLETEGFTDVDFGNALPPALTLESLLNDLVINGSFLGGGGILAVDLIILPAVAPTVFTYDATSGQLSVSTPFQLTSLQVVSAGGFLTGEPAQNLGGPADVDTDTRIFKQDPLGFGSLSFGNVMESGLTGTFLSRDLSIEGTLTDGGKLRNIQLSVIPQQNVVSVTYAAATGEVSIRTNAPLESLDITSLTQANLFTGPAQNLDGPDDIRTQSRIFKRSASGFRNLSFGNVATTGYSASEILLVASATLLGGDPVSNIEIMIIPEPVQTTFTYDANNGAFSFDSSLTLTTLEIVSASGIFTGAAAQNLGGQFDVDKDTKIFKLVPEGFGSLSFGNVARTGLPKLFLEKDLSFAGSRAGGGPIGRFEMNVIPIQNQTTVVYDATTGEIAAESNPAMSSLELVSQLGIFTGAPAENLGGPADVDTDTRIFKQDAAGFVSVRFGSVAGTGYTEAFISGDVTVRAAGLDGNPLSNVQILVFPLTPRVVATFDASFGELVVTSNSPLESISIVSASGIFTGAAAQNLGGPADIDTDTRIFKQDPRGFRGVSFGNVGQSGLDEAFVAGDLTITGTLLGGTPVERVELTIIPDVGPSTLVYEAGTGTIRFTTNLQLTTLEIVSARGIFTGAPAGAFFGGPQDVDSDTRLFKRLDSGFGNFTLARVAETGLTPLFVANDLTLRGTRQGGGGLGRIVIDVIPLPNAVTVSYLTDGRLSISSNGPLESFEIRSASGILTGLPALGLGGPNDVDTDTRIYKEDVRGFRSIDLGPVARAGLNSAFVSADLTFDGRLLGGEPIGSVTFIGAEVTLIYNSATGQMSLRNTRPLTTLEIVSQSRSFFGGNTCENVGPPFDLCTMAKYFYLRPEGFRDISLGRILPTNLTLEFLNQDLLINGSFLGGGSIMGLVEIVVIAGPPGAVPGPAKAADAKWGAVAFAKTFVIADDRTVDLFRRPGRNALRSERWPTKRGESQGTEPAVVVARPSVEFEEDVSRRRPPRPNRRLVDTVLKDQKSWSPDDESIDGVARSRVQRMATSFVA